MQYAPPSAAGGAQYAPPPQRRSIQPGGAPLVSAPGGSPHQQYHAPPPGQPYHSPLQVPPPQRGGTSPHQAHLGGPTPTHLRSPHSEQGGRGPPGYHGPQGATASFGGRGGGSETSGGRHRVPSREPSAAVADDVRELEEVEAQYAKQGTLMGNQFPPVAAPWDAREAQAAMGGGGHATDDHHLEPPTRCLKLTVEQPKRAYCCACGSYCFWFLAMIVAMVASNGSFLGYKNDVPLYLRDHVTKLRSDAIAEGRKVATYTIGRPEIQLERSLDELDDGGEEMILELIYIPKSGDTLELGVLQDIRKIEQTVIQAAGYKDQCLLSYSSFELAAVEAAAGSGDYAAVDTLNARSSRGETPCAAPNTILWACAPQSGEGCAAAEANPIGILNCAKTSGACDPLAPDGAADAMILDRGFKAAKVDTYAATQPANRCPVNATFCGGVQTTKFLSLVDSRFGSGRKQVDALRSTFLFGAPLPGFKTVDDRTEDQKAEFGDWLFDTYDKLLKTAGTGKVDVVYSGYGMISKAMMQTMATDASFALGSMLFVMVYIAFMTGSWWYAVMGMGQILLAFPIAYFLYYLVFQQRYFGVFNVMSIFIILGVGADDIFVMLDTWDRSGSEVGDSKGLMARLSWTWRHASKAMLITSVTTMISFLANATSSFPAIRCFGIFAAMLILVNYCAVIVYYPTVMSMYQACWKETKFCCGGPAACTEKVNRGLHLDRVNIADFKMEQTETGPILAYSPSKEGKANKWFRTSYAPMVMGLNIVIIVAFLIMLVVMLIQVTKLDVDPDPPQLLPDTQNYQKFMSIKPDYFARGGSTRSERVNFAWGFQPGDPIDREGTYDTDMENTGKPKWNEAFSLPHAANCIWDICSKAQEQNDARKSGGLPEYPIRCFILDFKEWVYRQNNFTGAGLSGEEQWAKATGRDADQGDPATGVSPLFYMLLGSWLNSDPMIMSMWKPNLMAEDMKGMPGDPCGPDEEECPRLRFVTAQLTLTVTVDIDPEEGEAIFGVWDAWMAEQYTGGPDDGNSCTSVKDQAQGFVTTFAFAFVKNQLIKEAFSGIYLSVGLAFVVLFLATGNVVIAIYSTLIISCIIICVIGTTVLMGWKLGILESIAFVMVPGMSVDFVAHLADGYLESKWTNRGDRVRDMLAHVGISVVSGAFSTLGASLFLFMPTIVFFNKFGTMIFITIIFSLSWSLLFLPALLATPLGPQANTGDWHGPARRLLKRE